MIRRILAYGLGHARLSFLLAIIPAIIAAYLGSGVSFRLSLADLLPKDRASVKETKEIAEEIGGIGYFIVLLGPIEDPIKLLPTVKKALEKNPSIKYAFYEREEYNLRDQILYLLPRKELKELTKQIHILFSGGEEPFSLGLDNEEEKKEKVKSAEAYLAKFKKRSKKNRYYSSKNNRYAMVLAKPNFDSEDIYQSQNLLNNVQKSLEKKLKGKTEFHLLGRYVNKVRDLRQMQKDIAKAASIALLAITCLLLFGLGSIRATLFTLISVSIAMGWTSGITAIWIGHINLLTGFFIAILGGLGVEYGIHMVRRYYQELEKGKNHKEAVRITHLKMTRILFSAALTSSAAFYILSFSNFKAFSELGKIAGSGILSVYFSYILCFPLTSKLLEKSKRKTKIIPGLLSLYLVKKHWIKFFFPFLLLMAYGLWNAEFKYNFEEIQSLSKESRSLNKLVNELFGKSLTPSALLAKDQKQLSKLQDWLGERKQQNTVKEAISIQSFTAPDRNRRQGLFRKLRKEIVQTSESTIYKKTKLEKKEVLQWLNAPNYRYEELPSHVRGLFGSSKNILLAYPREDLNDVKALYRFSKTLQEAKDEFPGLKIGSDSLIFTEILNHIVKDGKIVIILFLLGSFFVFWLDFRTMRDAGWLFIQLSLGMVILVGLMGLFHIPFTVINIAMLPAVLAAGVDMGVHVRHQEKGGFSSLRAPESLSYSIHLSMLAAIFGFAPLFLAQAAALPGVAWISIMGQVSMYLISMVIFPLFRKYLEIKRSTR